MILYLDTSSLVKLYMDEVGSKDMEALAGRASAIATSWLAYAEARSAFARKRREKDLTDLEYHFAIAALERDWDTYLTIDVAAKIVRDAGRLAEKHALKALDAVHLASALSVKEDQELSFQSLVLSSADIRLLGAGRAEGLATADDA